MKKLVAFFIGFRCVFPFFFYPLLFFFFLLEDVFRLSAKEFLYMMNKVIINGEVLRSTAY